MPREAQGQVLGTTTKTTGAMANEMINNSDKWIATKSICTISTQAAEITY